MYRTPSSRERLVPSISNTSSEKYSVSSETPGEGQTKKRNWCIFSKIHKVFCPSSTNDLTSEQRKKIRRRRMMIGAGISAAVTA
ncbi:hypothetical protein V866_006092 [Kwoniella sp. B9012]